MNKSKPNPRLASLLAIAASFGIHPGLAGGKSPLRKFFDNMEDHSTPPCPKCGPWQHRTWLSGDMYRCRACGHRFMPEPPMQVIDEVGPVTDELWGKLASKKPG